MTEVLLDRGHPAGLKRLPADAYGRLQEDPRGERILELLELARSGSGIVGFDPHTNFGYSTVQAGSTIIGSTASPRTIGLEIGDGPDFPTGAEFNVVIWPPGTRPLSSNAEIARVTRSGDTLTTTARGQEGTAALATIAAGYQVMAAVTKKTLTDIEDISVVATTVAGLGTGFSGKRGLLRLGATPYVFVELEYDATLAKWVSQPVYWVPAPLLNVTGTDALWGAVPDDLEISDYKAIYDAGLRLQVICAGRGSSLAQAWNYKLRIDGFNTGDTTLVNLATTAALISGSAAQEYRSGVWTDLVGVPTESHGILRPTFSFPASANGHASFGYRWVG